MLYHVQAHREQFVEALADLGIDESVYAAVRPRLVNELRAICSPRGALLSEVAAVNGTKISVDRNCAMLFLSEISYAILGEDSPFVRPSDPTSNDGSTEQVQGGGSAEAEQPTGTPDGESPPSPSAG